MRKIIDGKKYDTETATEVADWHNGCARNDFQYVHEWLYRKRTGEYFLYGEGGPESRYAEAYPGGGWQWGAGLVPLSYDEARRWAEQHLDADEYEAEFGKVDDPTDVAMTVRVPASAKAALDRECSRTGESRSAIVARLLAGLA